MIADEEIFDSDNYPGLTSEITGVAEQTKHILLPLKGSIFVSFLNNHYINKQWFKDYQALVIIIMSGKLKVSFTEMLLRSCRQNTKFKQDLENYIVAALR